MKQPIGVGKRTTYYISLTVKIGVTKKGHLDI